MKSKRRMLAFLVIGSMLIIPSIGFSNIEVDGFFPTNTTYTTIDERSMTFNATTNESAVWCNYSLNGGSSTPMTNNSAGSDEWVIDYEYGDNYEGSETLVFTCEDGDGNTNTSTVYYTLDYEVVTGVDMLTEATVKVASVGFQVTEGILAYLRDNYLMSLAGLIVIGLLLSKIPKKTKQDFKKLV